MNVRVTTAGVIAAAVMALASATLAQTVPA
jgi:hypothetical protein